MHDSHGRTSLDKIVYFHNNPSHPISVRESLPSSQRCTLGCGGCYQSSGLVAIVKRIRLLLDEYYIWHNGVETQEPFLEILLGTTLILSLTIQTTLHVE